MCDGACFRTRASGEMGVATVLLEEVGMVQAYTALSCQLRLFPLTAPVCTCLYQSFVRRNCSTACQQAHI